MTRVLPNRRPASWTLLPLLAGVATLYALLLTPQWSRGGDSEVYLTLARNLLTGEGWVFNGNPAPMIRPLWPLTLAGVFRLSPTFLAAKLLTLSLLLGWLACSWLLLRRWAGERTCTAIVGMTAILAPLVPLSYLPFSDPLFLLLNGAAMLLAAQVSEGRAGAWRITALTVLVLAAVLTRPAGLVAWLVLAALLWDGRLRPARDRRTLALIVSGVVCLAGFFLWPMLMRASPEQIDPRYDLLLTGRYELVNPPPGESLEDMLAGYERRWVRLGRLLATLYVDAPARDGPWMYLLNPLGWLLLLLLGWHAYRAARDRCEWWPAALLVLVAGISLNWPNPPARYLLPMAPLLSLSAVRLVARLLAAALPVGRLVLGALSGAILAGVLGYNLSVYVAEFRSARLGAPPASQDRVAGNLPSVARWLRDNASPEVEIAVLQSSGNRRFYTLGPMRALHFLLRRPVVLGPERRTDPPDNSLARWLQARNVRYFVYQPPAWSGDAGWRVYLIRDQRARLIEVPASEPVPTRVPGL